jgi:hypothetical protein
VKETHHQVSRAAFKYLATEQACHATGGRLNMLNWIAIVESTKKDIVLLT